MPHLDPDEPPMCPECTVRLRAAGTSQHPYLQCPGCGDVALPAEPQRARRRPVAQLVARVLSGPAEASARFLVRR